MKLFRKGLLTLALLAALASSAFSATISAPYTTSTWADTPNDTRSILAQFGFVPGDALFTINAEGNEEGSFAGSYIGSVDAETGTFSISHIAGTPTIDAQPLFLLVKDGNHSPAFFWYTISGWDRDSILTGSAFWPGEDRGAISFVGLYGHTVPDGAATLALLGTALVGLSVFRKRFA